MRPFSVIFKHRVDNRSRIVTQNKTKNISFDDIASEASSVSCQIHFLHQKSALEFASEVLPSFGAKIQILERKAIQLTNNKQKTM